MNHFDIRLTTQELDYIANALAQRPWVEVNTLLSNIKDQISMQQNTGPHAPAPAQHGNGLDHTAAQSVN